MEDYKEKFKSVLMKYEEYVEERLDKAKSEAANIKPEVLMNEVRTVNVLCVTYERMQHKELRSTAWDAGNN